MMVRPRKHQQGAALAVGLILLLIILINMTLLKLMQIIDQL